MKKYKIKTIKEIFDAVNEKNIDGFLIDFSTWLKLTIELRKLDTKSIKVLPNEDVFLWNDDENGGKISKIEIIFHDYAKRNNN